MTICRTCGIADKEHEPERHRNCDSAAPVPQIVPVTAARMIREMAMAHYRRGLGGQTGGELVLRDWFALADGMECK